MRSNIPENSPAQPESGFSRRQVATAAAWSLPVVALAVASPAASASVPIVYKFSMAGISAAGVSGQSLTGGFAPGASIRTSPGSDPVPGQVVSFDFFSADDEILYSFNAAKTAVTDSKGIARMPITILPGVVGEKLAFMTATWTDTSVTPNAVYVQTVTIFINPS